MQHTGTFASGPCSRIVGLEQLRVVFFKVGVEIVVVVQAVLVPARPTDGGRNSNEAQDEGQSWTRGDRKQAREPTMRAHSNCNTAAPKDCSHAREQMVRDGTSPCANKNQSRLTSG